MMKILATILFFSCIKTNATTYYVSSSTGNNSNNGTSTGSPFLTITYSLIIAVAGDNVLLKADDIFNEKVTVPTSGTVGNRITIGAYGVGGKPYINCFETATGFNNEGGNIWSKTITNSSPIQNCILIAGSLKIKGRWPNTSYATYSPTLSTATVVKVTTALPNYVGGEFVTRDAAFIIDVNRILSQGADSTVTLGDCVPSPYNVGNQTGLTYAPNTLGSAARTGYFIQNTLSVLDTLHEWYYDSTLKKLYVYAPSSPTVQFSTKDTGVYINHKNYITFDGIGFTGINKMAFGVDTCDHITITNCTFNNNGFVSIDGRGSTSVTVTNDSIMNCFSNGIWSERAFRNLSVQNCYFSNIGTKAGMGLSNNQRYMGIWSAGDTCNISYNKVDSIGFNGIYISGKRDTVYRNYVTNVCFVKDDGGGIVTYGADYSGSLIRSNIVQHGIGTGGDAAAGIYMDGSSLNITADSNTIEDTKTYGVIINSSTSGIIFSNNTVVDSAAFGMYLSPAYTLEAKGNVVYAKLSAQGRGCVIAFNYTGGRTLDSNYYLCPTNEATKLKFGGNVPYTLAAWQALTSWDAHTQSTPSNITSAQGVLYINPTTHDSTITFSGIKKDAMGTLYLGSATLHSFQSKLLFTSYSNYINRIAGLLFN